MNLKKIRQEKGLNQEEVAEIIKIKRSNVSRIENGVQKLNSDQIIEICKTLNVSADYLLGLAKDKNK